MKRKGSEYNILQGLTKEKSMKSYFSHLPDEAKNAVKKDIKNRIDTRLKIVRDAGKDKTRSAQKKSLHKRYKTFVE